MGVKDSKLMCCSERRTPKQRLKNSTTPSTLQQKKGTQHYEDVDIGLRQVNQQTHKSQSNATVPNFDIDKYRLVGVEAISTKSSRKGSEFQVQGDPQEHFIISKNRYEILIDQLFEFFEEKPYLTSSPNINQPAADRLSSENLSSTFGIGSIYERAYVETKQPSDFTVFLKRELGQNNNKFHSQVSVQVISGVPSLDIFFDKIDLACFTDCIDKSVIKSSSILQNQDLEDSINFQVVHTIFHPQQYQYPNDLLYLKINKRIDENTFVQVCQSITLITHEDTQIEFDPLVPSQKVRSSIRSSASSQRRQKQPPISVGGQRAVLLFSGKKISFNQSQKQVVLEELHQLDMKIDTSHYIQKQILIHLSKEKAESIKQQIASLPNK